MQQMHLTPQDLTVAQQEYARRYPRDIYYNVATVQVTHGLNNNNPVAMATGLAVLLLDWNLAFYIRAKRTQHYPIQNAPLSRKAFSGRYFSGHYLGMIEQMIRDDLLRDHPQVINNFRQRTVETFNAADEDVVLSIFGCFQGALGPVGASIGLHLIAPDFFPPWNNRIARFYNQGVLIRENNHRKYRNFMREIRDLKGRLIAQQVNVSLKAIDEYNKIRC
jgi:hypothetical protein